MAKKTDEQRALVTNRKARHEYFIEETLETGIVLKGTEVKSIRQGKANIKDAYISFDKGEAFIINMHISPYEEGNIYNVDPLRKRKLLLHKKEILKLSQKIKTQGIAIIPLKMYLVRGKVKLEIAVARGKKLYDKRQAIAEKDAKRNMDRELRNSIKF